VLSLDHITMQFGDRTLFDDVSLTIGPHDRIGLVGANGTGKSTLLRIIAGLQEPEHGTVSKARYVTVGYLPQDGIVATGRSLLAEAQHAFEDVLTIQQELEEAQRKLSTTDPSAAEYAETLEVVGELQHKLEDLDAYRMQSKAERVLMGLGFSVQDLARLTDEFSGGWQMRIALAKLLLQEPSILLLDEPTNHLDIDSLQWLEQYLQQYNGAIILVSHDRAFLDSVTVKTLALSMSRLDVYAGNYSFYEGERVIRKEQQVNAFKNQQRQIQQTQQFIDRFRYKATKARQVQSRIKQLEKIDLIEIEGEEAEIHFHFPRAQPSGAVVMELVNVDKSYGDKSVFKGMEYRIERGDRIAVVGPNGAGKSTFSRILAGVEPIDRGERRVGHNVTLSYFAQHQAEELDMNKEALDILDDVAVGAIRTKLRTVLGAFLFHGDDVFKKVKVLSGGEKSRLALAKMLLQPANFLIMDEPTNHLDMRSKAVLQEALAGYDGTIIIVSHDRAFLDPLVTKVLEVSTHGVRTVLGNVSHYLSKRQHEPVESSPRNQLQLSTGGSTNARAASTSRASEKDRKRVEAEHRQKVYRELKPLKDTLERIERSIETLEARKLAIENRMADPEFYKDGEDVKTISHEYDAVQQKLQDAYFEWNTVTMKMESIERDRTPT
jgi:ATP-binding cassette subfamily F protein 3